MPQTEESILRERLQARWYFGGLSSSCAALFSHPLDLMKVLLQTQHEHKSSLTTLIVDIVKKQGFFALYSGFSASLLRQMTYSMTRFAIYDAYKQKYGMDTFGIKVAVATFAGAIGGLVGTPGDLVNVRMQNDVKLPMEKRRNYKHGIDGVIRVYREEGMKSLFGGASTASARAILITIGQLSFYDQVKTMLIATPHFKDDLLTHFASSLTAGVIACTLGHPLDVIKTNVMSARHGEFKSVWSVVVHTAQLGPMGFFKGYFPSFARIGPHTGVVAVILTQPIDVVKTRIMNSKPGQFNNIFHCITHTAKLGPLAFYKGTTPSAVRVLPGTILLFLFYEDLIYYFGYYPTKKKPQ